MNLVEYMFSEPSFLLFVAVVFLFLGGSIVYFIMKPRDEYIQMLKRENEELRQAKNVMLERLIDYKEMENAKNRQR